MGSGWKRKSVGGTNTIFAVHSWQKYRKNGVEIRKHARKYRCSGLKSIYKGSGWVSAIIAGVYRQMPAGEEERRAGSRKCWKYTNTPQIRIRIHKIHTERQEIHKYKNTDTHKYKYHCWQSQPDRRSWKMRYFWKILLTKTALTSVPEKFRKVPGC